MRRLVSSVLFLTAIISSAQTGDSFRERIRNSDSFEKIFILANTINLEKPKGAEIQSIRKAIPIDNDEIVFLIAGKGIYKILLYNEKGEFKGNIGEAGYDPEDYFSPSSLLKDGEDNIYIFDPPKQRANIFTPDNEFKGSIPLSPVGPFAYMNSRKEIFIPTWSPEKKSSDFIYKFTPQGKKISEFGESNKREDRSFMPEADILICIDRNDFIYAISSELMTIRKFNSDGKLITEFGGRNARMMTLTDKNGKLGARQRYAENAFIYRDVLFICYDDSQCDAYDIEGELIKKDIRIKKRIISSSERGIYALSEGDESNAVYKFIFSE